MDLTPAQFARFTRHFTTEREPGGCWEWKARKMSHGRGGVTIGGRDYVASRVAYEAFVGPIGEGLRVCHRCDNPGCVRPDHLFLGTAKDNTQDMVAKGRSARGERHGRCRLTAESVVAMRAARAAGARITDLAIQYGMSKPQTSNICNGNRWRHVGGADAS